jgi:DNA mismatch repair protein MutS
MSKKQYIYDEYYSLYDYYNKKYGNKIAILMQVGDFYEIYDNALEKKTNLVSLSDMANLKIAKKSKKPSANDESNFYYMIGFNLISRFKFTNIFLKYGYTIIFVDQKGEAPNITREVSNIISNTTQIENIMDEITNYLMCIYIEINKSPKFSYNTINIGFTACEILINKVIYYDYNGTSANMNDCIAEINRFYLEFEPKELIVYEIDNTKTNQKVFDLTDIGTKNILKYYAVSPEYKKEKYQEILLSKVYNYNGLISIMDKLNLKNNTFSLISLMGAFNFINDRNPNLLNGISQPEHFNENIYLKLYNNAKYQLNLVDFNQYNQTAECEFSSINDVVNQCMTPLGKRYLTNRLCNPYANSKTIKKCYKLTEKLLKNGKTDEIRELLKGTCDFEKYFRKIIVKHLDLYEFIRLLNSLKSIQSLIDFCLDTNLNKYILEMFNEEMIDKLKCSIEYIDKTFIIDIFEKYTFKDLESSIYNKNIKQDIDDLQLKISNGIGVLDSIINYFKEIDESIKITIEQDKKNNYYLRTTRKNGNKLKEIIKTKKILELDSFTKLYYEDIEFDEKTKNDTKIKFLKLNTHSNEINDLMVDLVSLCKEYYIKDIKNWYDENEECFKQLIQLITKIDYISNNAYISKLYHYNKPIIVENDNSFINATKIRHPLIERIIEHEYIPHDIVLNEEMSGMLLFGLNSSGKSILMKSIGINLIMAQCGLYTATEYFEYSIFTSLYTRIAGNDNLFKGYSSFVVEMNELQNILANSNKNSLIIGDEICRGTEYISALSIVSASIIKLSELNAKFLFATHLHDIVKFDEIKNLKNIELYHLTIERKNNEIIFDRKLKKGIGEQIYGILIANTIIKDITFENIVNGFKNKLLEKQNINTKLVNTQKSRYNKDIYVDQCYFCKSNINLETHHINYQKDFQETQNGLLHINNKHIVKNDKANLIVLCDSCHDKTHNNSLIIDNKIKTISM